jgi:hypothetical protein
VADARAPEAQSTTILEEVRVSRRGFLNLSIAGIAGWSLFGAWGCGGSRDGGDGEKDDGSKKEDNKDDGGGGGAGGY